MAKLAGRGVYTNDEMEAWIERALDYRQSITIDVWYFIGMPEQDERVGERRRSTTARTCCGSSRARTSTR